MFEASWQDEAISLLKKFKKNNKINASFLLVGPEGTGKFTSAKWFASLINCEKNNEESCGNCSSCEKIEKNSHPDIFIISTDEEHLKIDQFRKMKKDIIYKPYEGKFKVFIIRDAQKMQEAAANSILKIIEEPPKDTVIILTATGISGMLPTIVSRCQKIHFNLVGKNKIIEILKRNEVPPDKTLTISSCSGGSLKKALELAGDDAFWNTREKIHEFANSIHKLNLYEALEAAELIEKKFKTKIDEVFIYFLSWFKDLMLIKEKCSADLIENIDKKEIMLDISKKYSLLQIKKSLDIIIEAKNLYKNNANTGILLANMMADLVKITAEGA